MTADSSIPSWISKLGITDAGSGVDQATLALNALLRAGRVVLGPARSYTVPHFVFCGLLARAQGLHEGCVAALRTDNPYAAFTLLRAYAENAAAVLYLKDKPGQLETFWREPNGHGISVGKIKSYARNRLLQFDAVYHQLSQYAHPSALSVLTSTRHVGDNGFTWQSGPAFKADSDFLVACAWVVELALATSHLLVEFAGVQGWEIGSDDTSPT